MNPRYAIEVEGLTKRYKNGKLAISDMNLKIESGKIAALLGPNGAGKSTFINILAGLVVKSSGKIYANGFDLDENPRELRGSLGIVPQEINFDPFFTPFQSVRLQAGLYGVKDDHLESRIENLLERMHLTEQAHSYARNLSGGMRRRLLMAKALVHNPPILFLDEPTAGVDIKLRNQLLDYIFEINKKRGTTVILTTHYLEEAEKLCDDITIMNHGHCVASGSKAEIMQHFEEGKIYISTDNKEDITEEKLKSLGLSLLPDGRLVKEFNTRLDKPFSILSHLSEKGIKINDMEVVRPNLSEVFLSMTSSQSDAEVGKDKPAG